MKSHIGMPCFLVHAKNKRLLKFDGMRAGDFRAVESLWKSKLRKTPVDVVMVQTGNTGAYGKPDDKPT